VFVLSYILSPTVIQLLRASLPPLTSDEISTVRAEGFHYAAQIRSGFGPAAASAFKADLETLANKLWADSRFEQQAPQETALIYRLYAATLLLQRLSDNNPIKPIRDALPWIKKAVALDDRSGDHGEFAKAENFFQEVAEGKVPNVELSTKLTHEFRVAIPGASTDEIEKHVQTSIRFVSGLLTPSVAGSSPKDDLNYLLDYSLGDFKVGKAMEVMGMELKGRFPNVDVGGQPIFAPLPNGNTLVRCIFNNGTKTLTFEWEVNKDNKLITAMNDATRELMSMEVKGPKIENR
jgi:hypothetical protein